ncbi:hypothetical protein D3C72_2488380 [compost metagenome]
MDGVGQHAPRMERQQAHEDAQAGQREAVQRHAGARRQPRVQHVHADMRATQQRQRERPGAGHGQHIAGDLVGTAQ